MTDEIVRGYARNKDEEIALLAHGLPAKAVFLEGGCVGKVQRAYDLGIVPMCAVPSDRKVICGRCGQAMDTTDDAEGCEPVCLPYAKQP